MNQTILGFTADEIITILDNHRLANKVSKPTQPDNVKYYYLAASNLKDMADELNRFNFKNVEILYIKENGKFDSYVEAIIKGIK